MTGVFTVEGSTYDRIRTFLGDVHELQLGAQLAVTGGIADSGEPAIIVEIMGDGRQYGFVASEVRMLLAMCIGMLQEQPDDPDLKTLPALVMGLFKACRLAEQYVAARGGSGQEGHA